MDVSGRVELKTYKRTKIITTIGPSTNSYKAILGIIASGANGLRLNFSHGTNEERLKQIAWIRKASQARKKPVAIIQDLQGPKIRLGDFEEAINVARGQSLSFQYMSISTKHIPVQYDLSKKVKPGERLYVFDGRIHTTITKVSGNVVYTRVENDGVLLKRKGINLPDTDFKGDIITAKDKQDIAFGATQDIDYVALSFVQSAQDISTFRKILRDLKSDARIIAKIETEAAVKNLESIVREADAIMVARGDLAIETSLESVPIVQRQAVGLGLRYAKPTIIATQMLASMTESPEPTRAEVSDIASAVAIGVDAVMLSEESAVGIYPIEAVSVMKRVILYTEANLPLKVNWPEYEDHSVAGAISRAIINLAGNISATAIVAETKSGATAIHIACQRSDIPVIAVASDDRVAQQLALVYGIKSYVRPIDPLAAQKLTDWLRKTNIFNKGEVVVSCSGRYPGVVGKTDTIKVRVLE